MLLIVWSLFFLLWCGLKESESGWRSCFTGVCACLVNASVEELVFSGLSVHGELHCLDVVGFGNHDLLVLLEVDGCERVWRCSCWTGMLLCKQERTEAPRSAVCARVEWWMRRTWTTACLNFAPRESVEGVSVEFVMPEGVSAVLCGAQRVELGWR